MQAASHFTPAPGAAGQDGLRWDIQALRGLAVAWVLLHHAQLPGVAGGYLGVDIFFVISGFLITGLIQRQLLAGRFDFGAFYARRARRLLPAAACTLALTALGSPWLLNASERADFAAQLWGTLGFVSNIVLWRQSGYFEGAAELKPLLHCWSLSLEEQYYLLLPALLAFSPARWRLGLSAALCVLSALLCAALMQAHASAAFYLLPSRAWELGLGSLGALSLARWQAGVWPRRLQWLGLPALLTVLVVPLAPQWLGAAHPGPAAAAVCVATLLLLLRTPGAAAPRGLRPAVWLGDRSYSLYLLHWPLLAALHNAWMGVTQDPALLPWRLAALALALLGAMAMYRFVERPAKRGFQGRRGLAALGALLGVVALLPMLPVPAGAGDGVDYARLRAANHGYADICDAEQPFQPMPACQRHPEGQAPHWMVWGDSYAMHLVQGLDLAAGDTGLIQATKSSCGPFPGLAPYRPELGPGQTFSPDWDAQCEAFNDTVMSWLAQHPEVDTVILSSLLTQYLDAGRYQLLASDPRRVLQGSQALHEATLESLRHSVQRLRTMGKRVLLIAPPPAAAFDIPACQEREADGRWTLGTQTGCGIDRLQDRRRRAAELAWLDAAAAILPVLRFEPLLCDARRCRVELDGQPLYRDRGHLSAEGSRLLGRRLDWAGEIRALR